jgi:hypothetical protein
MSEEYKDGYRDGFKDGYLEGWGIKPQLPPVPFPSIPAYPTSPEMQACCRVCGKSFTDSMGRTIALSMVCNHSRCPSKFTF